MTQLDTLLRGRRAQRQMLIDDLAHKAPPQPALMPLAQVECSSQKKLRPSIVEWRLNSEDVDAVASGLDSCGCSSD